jgi:hypothetical protein
MAAITALPTQRTRLSFLRCIAVLHGFRAPLYVAWPLLSKGPMQRNGKRGPKFLLQRGCNANATQFATRLSVTIEPIGKREDRKMGETSKHASSKHKRKEHRLAEKALARDGSARLAEAAKKREVSEAAARKAAG